MKRLLLVGTTLCGLLVDGIAWSQSVFTLETLNCHSFFNGEGGKAGTDRPRSTLEYSSQAGQVIALLPGAVPLLVGFQEIDGGEDLAALAKSASTRYGRRYQTLFAAGKGSAAGQDVGAILDPSGGWAVYGRPARVSDLERELPEHLLVRLTNAETSLEVCVVHVHRPIGSDDTEKRRNQCQALMRWVTRHLAADPQANLVILGDFIVGQPAVSEIPETAIIRSEARPVVDTLTKLSGGSSTPTDARPCDCLLVSPAIEQSLNQLRLLYVAFKERSHFPVVGWFAPAKSPPRTSSERQNERVALPMGGHPWMSTGGHFAHDSPPPWTNGNCLTFEAKASEVQRSFGEGEVVSWRVVNIHSENFAEITKRLGLTSVEAEVLHKDFGERIGLRPEGQTFIEVVDQGDCIITDRRIPREWFRAAPCRLCFRDEAGQKYVTAYPDQFSAVR